MATKTYVVSSSRAGVVSSVITDTASGLTYMVAGVGAETDVKLDINVALSSVSATGGIGTFTVNSNAAITLASLSTTGAIGSLTNSESVTLPSLSVTGDVGSLTVIIDGQLTGVQTDSAIGVLSVNNALSIALTGVQTDSALGDLAPQTDAAITLDGVAAVSAIDTLIANVEPILTGVETVSAIGTATAVSSDRTVILTGVAATSAVANVTPSVQPVLHGVQASGTIGAIRSFTGVVVYMPSLEMVGSVGTVTATLEARINLPSVQATGGIGRFVPTSAVVLPSVQINSAIGTIATQIVLDGLMLDDLVVISRLPDHADNKVLMRWSDTKGASWGNPVSKSLGLQGEYFTTLQWRRLGMGRDRIYELSWSMPAETSVTGAFLQFETAAT